MTDPRESKGLNNYDAWNCQKREISTPAPCNLPNNCALSFRPPEGNITSTRYLVTCKDCPAKYPWLGDSEGTGIPGKDNYTPESRT